MSSKRKRVHAPPPPPPKEEEEEQLLEQLFAEAKQTPARLRHVVAGPTTAHERSVCEKRLVQDWSTFRSMAPQKQDGSSNVLPLQQGTSCKIGLCTGVQVQGLRLFTFHGSKDCTFEGLPLLDVAWPVPVHLCSEFCTHARTLGPGWRQAEPVALDSLLPRGAYRCKTHNKVHCCGYDRCNETYHDALGFSKCVLSGFNVSQSSYEFSFSDGTGSRWTGESLTVPKTSRPSPPPTANKMLPVNGGSGGSSSSSSSSVTKTRNTDEPASGLFGNTTAENTFGAGLGETLDELYEVSWRAVRLLLFSEQRDAVEQQRRRVLQAEGRRRTTAYLMNEAKNGRWAFLDRAAAVYKGIMSSKHVYTSRLTVPRGAVSRLCAYYAMALVEFSVGLFALVDDLRQDAETVALIAAGNRAACALDRLHTHDATAMAVNCLLLLVSDFSGKAGAENVLFAEANRDPVLGMLPESSTIEKLGIQERLCTEIKKDIKYVLALAQKQRLSLERLCITTLPLNFLYYGGGKGSDNDKDDSIVHKFLQQRRARQEADLKCKREAAAMVLALTGDAIK